MFSRSRLKTLMAAALVIYVIFTFAVLLQMDFYFGSAPLYSDSEHLQVVARLKNRSVLEQKVLLQMESGPKPTWTQLHLFEEASHAPKSLQHLISRATFNFDPVVDDVYVYSAFLDRRESGAPCVRLVVVAKKGKAKAWSPLWCHFPSATGNRTVATQLQYYETCENHERAFAFYYMSCSVPKHDVMGVWTRDDIIIAPSPNYTDLQLGFKIPVVHYDWVEKTGRPWDQGHNLSKPVTFALCVPPLFGTPAVEDVVEMLEMTYLLGVNHVTFYAHQVSEELREVLAWYEDRGRATVLPWSLPAVQIWYMGQSAAIADCLLRNMYAADLVAFNDLDEVIFPHSGQDWQSMMENLYIYNASLEKNQSSSPGRRWDDVAAYSFSSAYFLPSIALHRVQPLKDFPRPPAGTQTLLRLARNTPFSKLRSKLIVDPVRVFELGIHHLSKPAREDWRAVAVPEHIGFVHHFRKCTPGPNVKCDQYELDASTLGIQPLLRKRVETTLWEIQEKKGKKGKR